MDTTLSKAQQRNFAAGNVPGSANYKGDTVAPSVPVTPPSTAPAEATTIPSASSTINSSLLAPSAPITPAKAATPTAAPALLGAIDTQAKQYADSIVDPAAAAAAKAAKDSSFKAVTDSLDTVKGEAQLTADAYAQEGVDAAKAEVKDINNQILQEQVGLQRRIEAIEKNPEGKFGGALAKEKELAVRDSTRKQADLSVIALAKQGKYDSAKEIADRAVTAYIESKKIENDKLMFTYQENKSTFDKTEQRQFETQQAERTRLLNKEESDLKAVNAIAIKALENGAPTDIVKTIQGSKNELAAATAAGKYLSKPEYTFKTLADGRDVMIDKLGNVVKVVSAAPLSKEEKEALAAAEQAKKSVPVLQDKIKEIDDLSGSLDTILGNGAVGPNALVRSSVLSPITGDKQNFIAGVQQLVSQETLSQLINLKQAGGTLGALSDGERETLQSAATKIGTWTMKDKDGNVTGYNTTEKAFKKELETIKKLTQRAVDNAMGKTLTNDEFLGTIPETKTTNAEFFGALVAPGAN